MQYFKTCPVCGDNLDPGEKCECNGVKPYIRQTKAYKKPVGFVWVTRLDGQIELVKEKEDD